MKRTVFTHLKNTDLHALSAFETVTHLMGYTGLRQLQRYQKWEFEFVSEAAADAHLVSFFEKTYTISNVNKESFSLEAPKLSPIGCRIFQVEATSPHVDAASIKEALNARFGPVLRELTHRVVWMVWVDSSLPQDQLLQEIDSQIVRTTSFSKGLLVNPLLETYTLRAL